MTSNLALAYSTNTAKNKILRVLITVLSMVTVSSTLAKTTHTIILGTYANERVQSIYKRYYPIIPYLKTTVTTLAKEPYQFKLKLYRNYIEANEAFVKGEIDITSFGPASYVIAKEKKPGIDILAKEVKNGKPSYLGFIIANSQSKIFDLEDVSGQSVAFGSSLSTFGRYLSQALLLKQGIDQSRLSRIEYLGSHDRVVQAVSRGDFAVGAVRGSSFKGFENDLSLRVIASKEIVGRAWIVRSGFDSDLKEHIVQSLLMLNDNKVLTALMIDGFVRALDSDYNLVRHEIQLSKEF